MAKLNLQPQTLQKLRQLTNTKNNTYNFLAFNLNLETATLTDSLESNQIKNLTEWHLQLLATLLEHYALAKTTPPTGKLVKFKDIPGGHAYEGAFDKRAIQPVAQFFGEKPAEMIQSSKTVGRCRAQFWGRVF